MQNKKQIKKKINGKVKWQIRHSRREKLLESRSGAGTENAAQRQRSGN